jgi:hypothetical protein
MRQFLIKWAKASSKENSWEPEEFLQNCPEKLEAFRVALETDAPYAGITPVTDKTGSVVIERRPRRSGRLRRRGIETEIESAWVSDRSIQSAAVLGGSNEPVAFDPWIRST